MKQQSIFRFFERNEAKKFDNKLKIDGYSVKYSQLTPFAAIQYFNEMVNKSVEWNVQWLFNSYLLVGAAIYGTQKHSILVGGISESYLLQITITS